MKKFQKNKEDFICDNCEQKIKGDGFTNHCPFCLWSKHVDINPGDRQSACRGMMKPAGIEAKKGEQVLLHKCLKCGLEKRNKISKNDNMEEIIKISSSLRDDL